LAGNLALHGGTALNLFLLEPQRLSLDLDLNYIASEEREQMLRDQAAYVGMVCDVGGELGFDADAGRIGHAGCTVKLRYLSEVTGLPDFVKVDLDFLNRTCLLPPQTRAMTYGDIDVRFLVNSPVEVVGGKVRAAASRTVPRDLYDLVRIGGREAWATSDPDLDHRTVFYNAVLSNRFPNHGDLAERERFEGGARVRPDPQSGPPRWELAHVRDAP
jgi:predicted nucleotidyltransferase component of viral defense system